MTHPQLFDVDKEAPIKDVKRNYRDNAQKTNN